MKKFFILLVILMTSLNLFSLTIFEDKFDQSGSKIEGFVESSNTYVTKYTGTYKTGTASMQIRGNNSAITYINVAPFKDLVLTFKMAKTSLETGEYVECQYKTGSTWVSAKKLLNTAANGTFTSYSVTIPLCNVLQVKFLVKSSATDDYGYIEEVKLTGNRK